MSQSQLQVISASAAAFAEGWRKAKLAPGDADYMPIGVDPSGSINFAGTTLSTYPGWDSAGNRWSMIVATAYNNGVAGTVTTVYENESGTQQSGVPTGFVLGDKVHGPAIAIALTPVVADLPTTDSFNLIGGSEAFRRYDAATINANITATAVVSYKTAKNTTTRTLSIPATTVTVSIVVPVSEGDYITYFGIHSPTANTGTISAGLTGYNANVLDAGVLRVNLHGAWRGSSMGDELRQGDLIPSTNPIGTGTDYLADYGIDVNSIPDVVDWVYVGLASTANGAYVTIDGLVRKDGIVIDPITRSSIVVPAGYSGSKFIQIQHERHLRIRTPVAISMVEGANIVWDFTTALNKAYDNTANTVNRAMKEVSTGVWAMWGGNASTNKQTIRGAGAAALNDLLSVTNAVGQTGYVIPDVNMNGTVTNTGGSNDYDLILTGVLGGDTAKIVTEHFL